MIKIVIKDAEGKEVHEINATDLKTAQAEVRKELEKIKNHEVADTASLTFFTEHKGEDMNLKDFLAINEEASEGKEAEIDVDETEMGDGTNTKNIEIDLGAFAGMLGGKGDNPLGALAGLLGKAGKNEEDGDNLLAGLLKALRESDLNKKIQMGIAMASMLGASKEKSPLDQVAIDFAGAEGLGAIMEFMKVQAMSPEEKKGLELKILLAFVAKHLEWPMEEAVRLSDMIANGLRTAKIAGLKRKLNILQAIDEDQEVRNLKAEIAKAEADRAVADLASERDALIRAGFTPEFVEKYFIERMIANTTRAK